MYGTTFEPFSLTWTAYHSMIHSTLWYTYYLKHKAQYILLINLTFRPSKCSNIIHLSILNRMHPIVRSGKFLNLSDGIFTANLTTVIYPNTAIHKNYNYTY